MPLAMPDASIPLSVNTPSLQNQLATMGQLQNLMQQSQEAQKQNALSKILGGPDAVDPTTGEVSSNALAQIAKVDPMVMQKLVVQNMGLEEKKRTKILQDSDMYQQKIKTIHEGQEEALTADAAATEKFGKEAGQKAGQEAWSKWIEDNKDNPLIPEIKLGRTPALYDPVQFTATGVKLKDFLEQKNKEKDEKRDDDKFAETTRHDKATEGAEAAKVKIEQEKVEAGKFQILTDPKNGTQFRYDPQHPEKTTDLLGNPYTPSGAAKLAAGDQLTPEESADEDSRVKQIAEFRAAPLGTGMGGSSSKTNSRIMGKVEKYATDNGYTYDATKYKAKQDAIDKFAAKGGADQLTRINTAIQHADTFDEVAAALKNGDNQAVNYAANKIAAWSGKPAPTNLEGVKAVFGPEIASAITGIGGQSALEDRKKFEQQLSLVKSPEQMSQLVDNYTSLLAGRTKELELQFTSAMPDIGKKNVKGAWEEYFNTKLDPETKTAIARTSAPREGMVKQTEYGPGTYRMGKDGKLHLTVQKDGKTYIVKDVE